MLTSYAVLRRDVSTLSQVDWDCVVLDEAQAIKNPDSQVAAAARALRARFRGAMALGKSVSASSECGRC